MSTSNRLLDKFCACGTQMIEVHMKNPFIDDFSSECPRCEPGSALARLNSFARSAAKAEMDDEREEKVFNGLKESFYE